MAALVVVIVLAFVAFVLLLMGLRIVQEYERGIVFRLGRVRPIVMGPGLHVIIPAVDPAH